MTATVPPDDTPAPATTPAPEAPTAAAEDAERPLWKRRRFLFNVALFVIVVLGVPSALRRILPYWWGWLSVVGEAVLLGWGVVNVLYANDAKAWARDMLDGPHSYRIAGTVVAAGLLFCGALYLLLPSADAPYLRIFVLNDVLPALQNGGTLYATIEAPGRKAKSIPLKLDDAEAWLVGWPEGRVQWNEKEHASDDQSIDRAAYDVLDLFGIPDDAKKVPTLTKPWKQAKTLPYKFPEKTKITLTLFRRDKTGRFVPSPIVCFAPTGLLPMPFEIKGSGPHDAFVGLPP